MEARLSLMLNDPATDSFGPSPFSKSWLNTVSAPAELRRSPPPMTVKSAAGAKLRNDTAYFFMATDPSIKRVPNRTGETVLISGQEGIFCLMLISNEFADDLLLLKSSG